MAPPTAADIDAVLTVAFDKPGSFDGPWLTGAVAAEAQRLDALTAGRADCRLNVVGHTDTVGRDPSNRALSEKRAAAVEARLKTALAAAGRGDDFAFAASTGWGERRLAKLTGDAAPEAANRRADIHVRCGAPRVGS